MFDVSPANERDAHRPKQMSTSKRVNVDVMSRSEIISGARVEAFFGVAARLTSALLHGETEKREPQRGISAVPSV